jgi:quercetin dioxygenase-like cupin family protein
MKEAQFYPKNTLVPKPIRKGARMWSVALDKTMFTYFEVDPGSRFDLHSHGNEQITMVLEGELVFKLKHRLICVTKGDVIAVPSNIPHEVFTQNSPVIAIDAWSPVMEKYRQWKKDINVLEIESLLGGCFGMKP